MQKKISNKILFLFSILAFFLLGTNISQAAGIDGACGSANGQAVPSAPTTNLCVAGTASVVTGTGPWTWNCVGSDATCTSGDSQVCKTTDNCDGKQTCTATGAWSACVKNVSTCGTNDYCNDQGQWCTATTGQCVNKCSDCTCPADKPTCNADGSCGGSAKCDSYKQVTLADGTCASQCSDGTIANQCSAASIGFQCVGIPDGAPTHVDLVAACNMGCPCPGNKICQGDGTCVKDPSLPESFSWADKNGVNWLSPNRNQGSSNNCWAYAAVGAVEAMYNIEHGAGTSPDLSEYSVVKCMGLDSGDAGFPDWALGYIKTKGVVEESCSQWVGNESKCIDTCSPKHGFNAIAAITNPIPGDMFRSVYTNGPFPIIVYGGTHAVLMIGWTSDGNILYKNSYGGSGYEWDNPVSDIISVGSGTPSGTY